MRLVLGDANKYLTRDELGLCRPPGEPPRLDDPFKKGRLHGCFTSTATNADASVASTRSTSPGQPASHARLLARVVALCRPRRPPPAPLLLLQLTDGWKLKPAVECQLRSAGRLGNRHWRMYACLDARRHPGWQRRESRGRRRRRCVTAARGDAPHARAAAHRRRCAACIVASPFRFDHRCRCCCPRVAR